MDSEPFVEGMITEIPTFTGQNVDLDTLAAKDLKRLLLLKLASILQLYGCPTHRMEYNLGMAAKVLGVTASFSVLPTVTFCSFQSQTEQLAADTIIVKVQRGFDMEKLALVDALAKEYKSMEQPYELTEAIIVLDDIISRPSGPPIWLRVLLMGLTSSSIASLFFHGSWVDFGISFVLGAMVGVMEWVAGWSSRFSKVFEICASVFGAFMGQALCTVIPTLCPSAISISSIIWLVPGMDMALATTELTVRNTVSGTTRMFQALYLSTLLGFGLTFGHKLVLWAPDTPEVTSQQCTSPVAPVFTYILVPVAAISLSLLLKATVRQCCVIVPIAIMGFVVNTYASKVFDGQTAAACSSFAVGLLGNVYSNISQTPAVIPILSGILLLVPGSLGLKGAAAFLKKDVMGGMQFSMDLITTSLCITLGLFAASMFVVPRKNTKSIVNMKF